MKKLIICMILAPLCGAFLLGTAQAQKTKAQLNTEVGTTFPDNSTGQITPSGVRSFQNDVINSIMPTAPVGSGNFVCFDGTTGLIKDCGAAPGGQYVGNPNIVPGPADSVKGSINGTSASDISLANCPYGLNYSTSTHLFGCLAAGVTVYNIVAYGAVSGADTASRNSNAIAAAITACASSPGLIWVPAGNYQFATAQQITTSGCSFAGAGPGASILTYTGVGIGMTVGPSSGANVTGISFADIGLICSASCSRMVQVQDVEQNIVFSNVYSSGGAETIRVTSNTPTSGGSFSVHFVNGTVIANCTTVCLSINPQGVAFAQAIYIDHVFFNGYTAQALSITSGSGIFVTNSRIERHPGTSNTAVSVHVDTTSKVVFRDNYIEDEANSFAIELGGGVAGIDILNNYFTLNNTGGSATSSGAIKHNGSASNPVMVNIMGNTFIGAGTMGKMVDFSAAIANQINIENNYVNMNNATTVFDFGSSTSSKAFNNRLIVGTVTKGIASAVGVSALAVCGNTFSGTYSTSQTDTLPCVAVSGSPTAAFATNWMGQVTTK